MFQQKYSLWQVPMVCDSFIGAGTQCPRLAAAQHAVRVVGRLSRPEAQVQYAHSREIPRCAANSVSMAKPMLPRIGRLSLMGITNAQNALS